VKRFKKEVEIESIISDLQKMLTELQRDMHTPTNGFLKAKVFYVILEHNHEKKKISESDIYKLKEACKIFQDVKSYKLECRALIKLAQIYENQPQESLSYARQALNLSKSHSIKELDKDIKALVMTANTLIRQQYQNKFYFLTSYPLRDQPPPICGGINFTKNLREEIMPKLSDLDRNILVHFDTFSSRMLQELIKENVGCKLLAIDFAFLPERELILEAPGLRSERLEIETIKKMVNLNQEDKVHIDILLVMSNESSSVITDFADTCEIPITIFFEFRKKPANDYDIMVQYLRREYMYSFLKVFTSSLIAGKKVDHCIEGATQDSIESIYHILKNNYSLYHVLASKGNDTNFETIKENWTLEVIEEVLKDCVKCHKRSKDMNISCELGRGKLY
jgi:hypothetical protein